MLINVIQKHLNGQSWYSIINKKYKYILTVIHIFAFPQFGKGVYFADVSSKSANYCYATKSKNVGLVLLCEVCLRNVNLVFPFKSISCKNIFCIKYYFEFQNVSGDIIWWFTVRNKRPVKFCMILQFSSVLLVSYFVYY